MTALGNDKAFWRPSLSYLQQIFLCASSKKTPSFCKIYYFNVLNFVSLWLVKKKHTFLKSVPFKVLNSSFSRDSWMLYSIKCLSIYKLGLFKKIT